MKKFCSASSVSRLSSKMATPIDTPSKIPDSDHYTHLQEQMYGKNGKHGKIRGSYFALRNISFLPVSAINELATLQNISALVSQDHYLAQNFRIEWFEGFSRDIFSRCKKIFLITVSQGLSMLFLAHLMGKPEEGKPGNKDELLPFPNDFKVTNQKSEDICRFLESQKLVCAPVFVLGNYTQTAPFFSSLPILEAPQRKDKDTEDFQMKTYDVLFHRDHVHQT
jgi:hypothetical protein